MAWTNARKGDYVFLNREGLRERVEAYRVVKAGKKWMYLQDANGRDVGRYHREELYKVPGHYRTMRVQKWEFCIKKCVDAHVGEEVT